MDCYKSLILLFFGYSLNSCSQFPPQKYYYIDKEMNWTDAQQFCRENFTDLATFKSLDDIKSLKSTESLAWIGLSDDPESWKYAMGNESNSWRWSATGETSKTGFSNWMSSEPQDLEVSKICVTMQTHGEWKVEKCDSMLYFICYTGTNENQRTYTLFTNAVPWDSALEYCRTKHTDLAMIENFEQNNQVYAAKLDIALVWIGLYRVPWAWSDKSQSSFTNWLSGSPNNVGGKELCVVENDLHEWDDRDCQEMYPVICHQVSRLRKMLRVKFQTDAVISDPAVMSSQILQKLSAVLAAQGWTDVTLNWRIQPKNSLAEDKVDSKEKEKPSNSKVPPGKANKA